MWWNKLYYRILIIGVCHYFHVPACRPCYHWSSNFGTHVTTHWTSKIVEMNKLILLALAVVTIFSTLFCEASSTSSFTASFEAGGADGYFQMKLPSNGMGTYDFLLDMTNFTTSCDLSAGLTCKDFIIYCVIAFVFLICCFSYCIVDHIHTYWTDPERTSVSTCGTAGGHYDPYLACGTSSEDKAGLCLNLGRTVDKGYAYGCSPMTYSQGHFALCEVGDISG